MGLFKRNKDQDKAENAALQPLSASEPGAADGLVQDPLAGGAGMMAGLGGMGGVGGLQGMGALFSQLREMQHAMTGLQTGAGGMPVIDTRNDPELRAKVEQVLGHPLEDGHMETLDFSSDPQKAMALMQVIQQHQLEKMGFGGAVGAAGAVPGQPVAGNDAAAAGVMGVAAAATMGAMTPGAQPAPADDELSKLERLAKLHESGALTDEEFATEKKRLLGET